MISSGMGVGEPAFKSKRVAQSGHFARLDALVWFGTKTRRPQWGHVATDAMDGHSLVPLGRQIVGESRQTTYVVFPLVFYGVNATKSGRKRRVGAVIPTMLSRSSLQPAKFIARRG
jgi:hypothetical protein